MIRVIGDYYVTIDESPLNYVVRRGTGKHGNRGQWKDKPIGFYGSLSGALGCIRKQVIAQRLSVGESTLDSAISTIRSTDAELKKLFESVTA